MKEIIKALISKSVFIAAVFILVIISAESQAPQPLYAAG